MPHLGFQNWRKQLNIQNDTDHMINVARYIYNILKLRTQPQQNEILRFSFLCYLSLLAFCYLQTPCPMSACLVSYIHAWSTLQTPCPLSACLVSYIHAWSTLQTPCPMSACLVSYIHAWSTLQTLPFECVFSQLHTRLVHSADFAL